MIRGAAFRLLHNPEIGAIREHLSRIKAAGATDVSIVTHNYISLTPGTATLTYPPPSFDTPGLIYADEGQDSLHPFHNTPDIGLVHLVCTLAQEAGLNVLLKPHIDPIGGGHPLVG